MSIPRLNRRLALEAPQETPDGAGGFTAGWTTLGMLWAAVDARTGREMGDTGGAALARVSYKITVRGAPQGSPARPRPEQRFREGERVFKIRAVTEADATGMYLMCFADEEVVA